MVMEVREEHWLKVLSPMVFTEVGIVIVLREVQDSNAPLMIEVTLVGIVTEVRDVQEEKIKLLMVFIEVGMMITLSEEHW